MRYAANEPYSMWVWRHTTDQSVPFEQWQAEKTKREAAAKAQRESSPEYQAAQAKQREQYAANRAKAQADYEAKRAEQGCKIIKCAGIAAALKAIDELHGKKV